MTLLILLQVVNNVLLNYGQVVNLKADKNIPHNPLIFKFFIFYCKNQFYIEKIIQMDYLAIL